DFLRDETKKEINWFFPHSQHLSSLGMGLGIYNKVTTLSLGTLCTLGHYYKFGYEKSLGQK
ncbi:MAG: hypothetical protein IJ580_08610, partial [Prevotella sp.]|nr:hypothetical protein [Prevotella sp.]